MRDNRHKKKKKDTRWTLTPPMASTTAWYPLRKRFASIFNSWFSRINSSISSASSSARSLGTRAPRLLHNWTTAVGIFHRVHQSSKLSLDDDVLDDTRDTQGSVPHTCVGLCVCVCACECTYVRLQLKTEVRARACTWIANNAKLPSCTWFDTRSGGWASPTFCPQPMQMRASKIHRVAQSRGLFFIENVIKELSAVVNNFI